MKYISIAVLGLAVSFSASAVEKTPFNIRDLAAMERVSSPTLSPNGQFVIFAVREADVANNKSKTGLWIRNLLTRDAKPPARFTDESMSVNSPSFSPDGKTVYFLSAKSGSMQLWAQSLDAKAATQISNFDLDVGSYKISPDGKSVALSFEVFNDCVDLACTKKRLDDQAANKASGVIYDKLFIRHWDTWADGRRNQLYVASLSASQVGSPVKVSRGIDGDVPSKPYGDASEYAWSPDSKTIVFSVRIAGKTEAWSTNFDLYRVNVSGNASPKNLTAENLAWDTAPLFSHDGKILYYTAMKRAGFEADRFGIMAMNLATGKTREIAANWDRSAGTIKLSSDGKTIYTGADDVGQHPLFAIDIASGTSTHIAGNGTVNEFDLVNDTLAFTRDTLTSPAQLFIQRTDGGAERQISVNNSESLTKLAMGEYEQFNFIGAKGEKVHGYVVKPANYQEGKSYPVAFLIHGGPQGSFGNHFHYRWNPQTYAGQGFAVVMIDFHGSTGYGQAFTDAISGDWGGAPLEDLQKGWAAALNKYAFLDGDRACALGGSYGGYMTNWIAGNWSAPWKCLVTHSGIFDNRMMSYSTEELWFDEWEMKGLYYQNPSNFERHNPVNHVAKWQVPMLVIHGQLDYRITVEQGIGAFTALQRKGIESQFLYFPDENHWILRPQNSILWHDTVNTWLKRWTVGTK
ncbi:MAG TPA: S9 family peptidase [Arenimonas sp.]|nr:S9 family peptidase [Arenimonas sp.]